MIAEELVLVAEASRARLFALRGGRLDEIEDFVHGEGRLHEQALDSDRPGRTFSSGGSGHTLARHSDRRHSEDERFAAELVAHLETLRANGALGRVNILAPAHFLGLLRAALGAPLARCVGRSVAVNLARAAPADILARLQAER